MAVICKRCGGPHPIWVCKRAEVRKDSSSRSEVGGRAPAETKKQDELAAMQPDTRKSVSFSAEPRKSHFDKVAYQRDYMRKRRAAQKEGK